MSILTIKEDARGAGGTAESVDFGGDDERVFVLTTNSASDNKYTLLASGQLPAIGSSNPLNHLSTCRRHRFERIGKFAWRVTAEYSTRPESERERDNRNEPNPINRTPVIRWTTQSYMKALYKDRDGVAVVNSAGEYFDPPPEVPKAYWVVTIQQHLAVIPSAILGYTNATNSDQIVIDGIEIDPEHARITGIDISEKQYHNDIEYRTLTLTVELRTDTHDLDILNQGFKYIDLTDGNKQKDILIEDENGNRNRPSAPVLLNSTGQRIESPTPANATYRTFQWGPSLEFAGLPGIFSAEED